MIAPGIDDAGVKYATKVEVIAMINPAAVMLKSKPLLYSVADKLMTKNNITVLFPILVNIVVAIAITIKENWAFSGEYRHQNFRQSYTNSGLLRCQCSRNY